ncbi:hypothetical protein F4821DRAFT_228645 [Hypoxylon rubiginosum]|uniref:Uncharacterized protein n=1 Tax=Hypoxylon rubiginosum TaxID=110542 RepID=A0ACC0DDJ5_9PEZI|nr:hypothetical protein F4821DRAFT_228645 [Hypoxylon rubiginosum]
MADKDMRLRLVVRRDGFPEERLVWNVSLETDPTISKLLEKVNEVLPLEVGQRGLENYVVELHDSDGTSFECLHFQTVRSVLKPDDRVFIRALEKDDNRRRRISGRHQISSDGRHLIDGIPFGRRLLRPTNDRPVVNPPPRKRPRLAYNQEDADDDFIGEDSRVLLLTNGESLEGSSGSPSVRIDADFDDADADAEDDDFDSEGGLDDIDMDDDYTSDREDQRSSISLPSSDSSLELLSSSDGDSDEEDLEEELQDLVEDNAAAEEREATSPTQDVAARVFDGEDVSKVSALETAFPSAPAGLCKNILISSDGNLKEAYSTLADGFKPALSESAVLSLQDGGGRAPSKSKASGCTSPSEGSHNNHTEQSDHDGLQDDEMQDDEDSSDGGDEEVSTLVRVYDQRGFPPGTINVDSHKGKQGLAKMAAISRSFVGSKAGGESETTSATLSGNKTSPEKTLDEGDTSSSDPLSSEDESSSGLPSDSSSDSDNDEDDDHSSDSEDDDDEGDDDAPESRNQGSHDLDNSSDSSSDDSDSSPEETSTKPTTVGNSQSRGKGNADHDDSIAETSGNSSMSSSDEESSDSESDEEEEMASSHVKATKSSVIHNSTKNVEQAKLPEALPNAADQTKSVPPGAGKESTKRRNARRRAAKKGKMLSKQAQDANELSLNEAPPSAPALDEKALFEAKRQELLDAIANGGVDVGPSSPPIKRKRDKPNKFDQDGNQESSPLETPASEDIQSSASTQKRRRIDAGAGRRLVFGALDSPNPKTNEGDIELQTKLQNPTLVQGNENIPPGLDDKGPEEEGLETWRDKITYRAVECCHEGVQLSEPPFPFVQRWDPQQQGSWFKKNKRGGQSKRAQRNEAHFYQDSRAGKKRNHDESSMWDEEEYDDTYNGIEDYTNNADIELNYDDEEISQPRETNEASQFMDMDDLPSLPSNLTDLPDLRPGEVKVGMVITWQQWLLSATTNWQPQVSNMTGVVVRVDDDATGLEVCLAKRDRNLDRTEKKYDQSTGKRIYDRFEAPDLDDEEGEDEDEDDGFRTIGFAEMQQPRILQQPLPMAASEESSGNADDPRETSPKPVISHTPRQHTAEPEPSSIVTESMEIDMDFTRSSPPQDATWETIPDVESSVIHRPGNEYETTNTSMSDSSRISSPSRQLQESTSQAISAISRERSTQDISSREYFASDDTNDIPDTNISTSGLLGARQSSIPSFHNHEDEVVTGTPKIVKTKVTEPPSSISSARSGRQPDHTFDMDSAAPDSFKITDDGMDATSAILDTEDQHDAGSDRGTPTPTPKRAQMTESNVGQVEAGVEVARSLSPANPSTPSSLESLNTVWHTAVTSRNTQSQSTQSPSKSQPVVARSSPKAFTSKDKEYDEAMRKLDRISEDQDSVSRIPDSFRHSSQPVTNGSPQNGKKAMRASTKSPQIKMSPAPTFQRGTPKQKRSSQFSIPPGSQVIELSSDSEPAYSEDYAEDAVDSTYSPGLDSLPQASQWLPKKKDLKEGGARSSTAPIKPSLPKKKPFLSSSQSRLSTSSLPASSQIKKPRRKTSSRF